MQDFKGIWADSADCLWLLRIVLEWLMLPRDGRNSLEAPVEVKCLCGEGQTVASPDPSSSFPPRFQQRKFWPNVRISVLVRLLFDLCANGGILIIRLMAGQGGDWDMNNALQWEGTVSGLTVVSCVRHGVNWRPRTRSEWLPSLSLEEVFMLRTSGNTNWITCSWWNAGWMLPISCSVWETTLTWRVWLV